MQYARDGTRGFRDGFLAHLGPSGVKDLVHDRVEQHP